MKRFYTLLALLCALAVCSDGAEAQIRFKQASQRRKNIRKEQILKHLPAEQTPTVDSTSLVQSANVEVAPVAEKDSVVAPKVEQKPFNPYLNLTLTPARIDSLVARWDEMQNALAFDNFFADYITLDSLAHTSASLPDSVYESRVRWHRPFSCPIIRS